jgi:hypothetical protein
MGNGCNSVLSLLLNSQTCKRRLHCPKPRACHLHHCPFASSCSQFAKSWRSRRSRRHWIFGAGQGPDATRSCFFLFGLFTTFAGSACHMDYFERDCFKCGYAARRRGLQIRKISISKVVLYCRKSLQAAAKSLVGRPKVSTINLQPHLCITAIKSTSTSTESNIEMPAAKLFTRRKAQSTANRAVRRARIISFEGNMVTRGFRNWFAGLCFPKQQLQPPALAPRPLQGKNSLSPAFPRDPRQSIFRTCLAWTGPASISCFESQPEVEGREVSTLCRSGAP